MPKIKYKTMNKFEVKTGEGLNDIKFGITREELESLLGKPDEVDGFSYEEDGQENDTEAWHYDEYEISFSFDKDDNWLLGTIASSAEDTIFAGEKIMGLDPDSVMNLLRANGIDDAVLEDLSTPENPNHHVIMVEDDSINFWFEDGELSEVQWSPFWEDEETIVWPN